MLRKLKISFLVLCCCLFNRATAQHWDSLSSGLDYQVYSMYADSVDNYLYVCGPFDYAGGSPTGGIAKWDGTSFSYFTPFATGSRYCRSLTRFHDTIYAAANFWSNEEDIGKWNGISWDSIGHVYDGAVFNFVEYNNELYAVGVFDSIANAHANNIAKWNGTSWSTLKDTVFNNAISAMVVYNNEIYIGGSFYNTSTGVSDIMKWNGTNYVQISGGGIYGGIDDIIDMVVYDSELYVSGTFSKADGNVGNYIQKWNGTSWSEVGGGVIGLSGGNGQIQDMKVYNGELYVVGDFETAGGVHAQYIAKWNGTDWCGYGSSFDNVVGAIAFKNGDMYIAGGFTAIDGTPINYVSKWIGGTYLDTCGHISTGIDEQVTTNELFNIYPNPATNSLTLEFENQTTQDVLIEVKNVLGQTMYSEEMNNVIEKQSRNIDVFAFPNGLYFVQSKSNNTISSKKFIKE